MRWASPMKAPRPPPTMPRRRRRGGPAGALIGRDGALLGGDLCRLHPLARLLVEGAVLHDREQAVLVAQDGDIRERIAVDQQEVREIAGLDLAEFLAHAHDLAAQ